MEATKQIGCGYCANEQTCLIRNPHINKAALGCEDWRHHETQPPAPEPVKKYCPSNGSEGEGFMSKFCDNCAFEKYSHTYNDADTQCDILTRSMVHNVNSPEYPAEWQYTAEGVPTCTAHKYHQWRGSDGELIEPESIEPTDPAQLDLFVE